MTNEQIKHNLRLKVLEVEKVGPQKIIVKATNVENEEKIIGVEGVWTQNLIPKNATIHVVNPVENETAKSYTIDNSNGFLVIEPDSLLTCTLVASSLFCERKTWLNNVYLGQVGTNRAMLVGTLVHEVFQYGVKNKMADVDKLTKFLDDLLDDATIFLEIYSVELHLKDIRSEAIGYLKSVKEWIEMFMLAGPRYPLTNDQNLEVKIVGVSDIEENVWSTKYGLKGKIDVTGSVRIHDKRSKSVQDKTIPLELKTGNPNLSASHAAQVSLYSMMIEDRYAETNQGFVIYLKDRAAMHNVTLNHNIKRDLIQRRNRINYHMKSYYFGPDMIDQPRICSNCERLTECILTSKLYTPEKINEYSTMKSHETAAIGHLDDKFIAFFQKYHEKLVALMTRTSSTGNEGDDNISSGSFWNYSSEEAESRGTGFGKLQAKCNKDASGSIFVTFTRHPKFSRSHKSSQIEDVITLESDSENDSQPIKKLKINDYFKPKPKNDISPAKSKPFNTKLNFSRCRIAISLDSDNHDMDTRNSTTALAIGFMNELNEESFNMKLYEGASDIFKADSMYRVDKLEKRTSVDIERLVLVRLIAREDWRCDRVRQLILDPKFEPKENLELNLFVLTAGFEEVAELDADKQKFVVEAVSTDNYFILDEKIEPKKEKAHQIVSVLARMIRNLERSVLIVGHNLDDLTEVMRLLQIKKVRFVLIDDGKSTKARYKYGGNLIKVPQTEGMSLDKKFDLYVRQHEMASVVFSTFSMSIAGLQFTRKIFDYTIIYDCDTTELLMSLSPMFCSDRYILVDIQDEGGKTDRSNASLGQHLRCLHNQKHPQVTSERT